MNTLAIRGAAAFGLPVAVLFLLAVTTSASQTGYVLAAGPLCGIIGGLAFGRRFGLPLVLTLSFGFVGVIFLLQDVQDLRSSDFLAVVFVGIVSAFLFWVVGIAATLTLPAELRFAGAKIFAIPGAIAGMAFQFFYGPARFAFDLGARSWWGNAPWEHFIFWSVAASGTGFLLGRDLHRLQHAADELDKMPRRSRWALASVVCGIIGLGISVVSFTRYSLPFGLLNSLSPATEAADWLRSWGVVTLIIGMVAAFHTFRKRSKHYGRGYVVVGLMLGVSLLVVSQRIGANPWKGQFNASYAERLLRERGNPDNPDSADAIYTGNLILAQAALDADDIAKAGRYLLEAARTSGTPKIQQNGPNTTVARSLLQRGERDIVIEYFQRFRDLWPQGATLLARWETTIRAGRQPNFNNRTINPPDASPERR
jgi:hypothetical protein